YKYTFLDKDSITLNQGSQYLSIILIINNK
uniref:Uncharacterized protein n=1 Tax=Amphimedon queenslandica TaxID=400682 RepID=A0A1X7T9V3_AMPQE